ncbi:hypothetical protein PoB_005793100 [Plakobranchus ocellatus]|uniref:Uncharacterized protein n=1 Tax=Plakobranchus ocellatus TaxID=259542 RepID=A0AAV4CIX3_9GAST|nr:hypothetical protein PoB_005793100 [Plakobranchus ocellatus]
MVISQDTAGPAMCAIGGAGRLFLLYFHRPPGLTTVENILNIYVFNTCATTPVTRILRYEADFVQRSRLDGESGKYHEEQCSLLIPVVVVKKKTAVITSALHTKG